METKLKRAVIKEELVALTGDFVKAVILNQFLYWSERVKDVDAYLLEEQRRMKEAVAFPLTHGWIYKSAEQLSEETMLGMNRSTILRHIERLVENGYLLWRMHPERAWDKTRQYRPDLVKIRQDLRTLGYDLQGYRHLPEEAQSGMNRNNNYCLLQNATSVLQNTTSKAQNATALPEITPETQTETTTTPPAPDLQPPGQPGLNAEDVVVVSPSLQSGSDSAPPGGVVPPSDAPVSKAAELSDALVEAGVTRGVAEELASRHPPERIRQQLDWLPQRKAEDPAAVLVAAIMEDWAPPPAVMKARRKEKQQAEKQTQARTLRQRQAEDQARARAEADRQDACWQQLPHEERLRIEADLKAKLKTENPFLGQRMEGRPDSPAVVKLLDQLRRQYLTERFPAPPLDS